MGAIIINQLRRANMRFNLYSTIALAAVLAYSNAISLQTPEECEFAEIETDAWLDCPGKPNGAKSPSDYEEGVKAKV